MLVILEDSGRVAFYYFFLRCHCRKNTCSIRTSVTRNFSQIFVKVAQKWFHLKKDIFLRIYKNCLKKVGDLCKLIVALGLKSWPKCKKIAQSGHTGQSSASLLFRLLKNIENYFFLWFPLSFIESWVVNSSFSLQLTIYRHLDNNRAWRT